MDFPIGSILGFKRPCTFTNLLTPFPSLGRLDITFREDIGASTSASKLQKQVHGQLQIIDAILRDIHSSNLTSLSLNNTLALPDDFLRSHSMEGLFASLASLDVSFAFYNGAHYIADYRMLLSPVRSDIAPYQSSDLPGPLSIFLWRLTHLKLGSTMETSCLATLDFTQLRCPNLESLAIENMTFRRMDVAGSLENFILSHSALRKLALKDCMISFTGEWGPRYWSTMYDAIAKELTHLVEVYIEFGPIKFDRDAGGPEAWLEEGQEVQGLTSGYCEADTRGMEHRFFREYLYNPGVVAMDDAALRRLHAIVDERRRGLSGRDFKLP